MRQTLLTLLCMLLLLGRGQAQSPGKGGFTRYTRAEGLSNNDVTGIAQDSLGYIWVATGKGLNRFDGRFFTSFYTGSADLPLPSNDIIRLKMQGREIIGSTSAGAFSYNTGTRRFKRLVIPSDSLIFFWENTVYEASRDGRGGYVLSTKTGLYAFDSLGRIICRYDHYHPGDAGRVELWFGGDLFELQDGRILQQNDLLFSSYDPVTNSIDTAYAKGHPALGRAMTAAGGDLRTCFPGRIGEAFIYDKDKNVLNRFDLHMERMTALPVPFDGRKEIDGSDSRLFVLGDSLLAITCGVSGFYLLSFDAGTGRLSLRGGKYFDGKQCSVVFRDYEGRLWVGTNEGLFKENLSNPMFSAYDLSGEEQELKNCNIRAIYADDRDLFVGLRNKGGILVLDKASKRPKRRILLDKRDSVSNDISLFFPYDRDTLWVGTRRGLFWLDRNRYTSGRVAVPPALTRLREHNGLCFLEDRDRNIWMSFGGLNTVVRYDRATRRFIEISSRENPLMRITFCFSMAEDRDGNIWLGGDGICRWNPRKQAIDTLIPYPRVGHALRNFFTLLGCDGQNDLWLTSPDNGILRFNCTTGRMTMQKEDNDLTDGSILANSGIIRDTVWLAVENGILAFSIRDNSVHLFPYADGLPTLAVTSIAKGFYYDEGTHMFYFGSRRHLIAFRPDASNLTDKAPSFFIDRISTAQGPLPENPDHIDLGYANNSLSVDFDAINFTYPEGNRFAYQFVPSADSTWHLLNWQRSLNFYNLAPGVYHVRLKLFSDNNRWPGQYKDLEVVIHPPIWRKAWFAGTIVAAALLMIIGIYRIRIRRIREKLNLDKQIAEFEMKALHAQMNPHFIFNALNSIREMILHDDNRNASRYLSRFARLIRLNLEHSRQTFITLQQNVDYLESYLEMEQLRFSDFSFRIIVSPLLDGDEVRLAPMLIQPLVENAIWHGLLPKDQDKWVQIRFFAVEGKLVCEIEDNGIGIHRSLQNKTSGQQMHRSMGIANIRERIAVLNEKYRIRCSLTIVDKTDVVGTAGSGTLITLVFPVQEEEFFS